MRERMNCYGIIREYPRSSAVEFLYNPCMQFLQKTSLITMLRKILAFFLLLSLLLGSVSCQARPEPPAWTMADLRLLDALDASTPQTELIALYTRNRGLNLEIRLDLLDLLPEVDTDLQIIFSTPEEEVTLLVPAISKPSVTDWKYGLGLRAERDPEMDTVIVHLNRLLLPKDISLQVIAIQGGGSDPADETSPVRLDAAPRDQSAQVLFAFWDVFPSATPAQALRRWSGAHTGPYGGPHGLKHLLNAVEKYEFPVTLLDLLSSRSLAALAFTDGALAQVQRLSTAGLLTLTGAACGQPADIALSFSRQSALDFGLPISPIIYSCEAGLQPGFAPQFIQLDISSHLGLAADTLLIPLPSMDDAQATSSGPSLPLRRQLLEVALSGDPSDFVTLGGSLPNSTWGVPDAAANSFAWLAAHPWVGRLNSGDLLYSSYALEVSPPAPLLPDPSPWLAALRAAPDNALTRLAWQTTLMLTAPIENEELQALRGAYTGQIGILLAAADWAESPHSLADCSIDPDQDGHPECLLADENVFAVIETNGGRLSHLFLLDESGPHQLIAPTSQFTLGLSDPSTWQPELGDAADPGAVMGAFSNMDEPYAEYRPSLSGGVLTLAADGISKIFRLMENGIEVTVQSDLPVSLRIPLVVDPQAFYSGASYVSSLSAGAWTWGPAAGLQAEVRTAADLFAEGFTVSKALLDLSEDPDLEYPPMHYFPFPFSLVTVSGEGEFTVFIGRK